MRRVSPPPPHHFLPLSSELIRVGAGIAALRVLLTTDPAAQPASGKPNPARTISSLKMKFSLFAVALAMAATVGLTAAAPADAPPKVNENHRGHDRDHDHRGHDYDRHGH